MTRKLLLLLLLSLPLAAQTPRLQPPAGAAVAIYEFEDMECPGCAHAAPIVRGLAAKYHVPLLRHDYVLTSHAWSLDAAIYARFLEDATHHAVAERYRLDLFGAQARIASREDLRAWSLKWFRANNQVFPTAAQVAGKARTGVLDDRAYGDKLGVHETPTFYVVTRKSTIEVEQPEQLEAALQAALKR